MVLIERRTLVDNEIPIFPGSRFGGALHLSVAIPNGASFRGKIPNWRHKSPNLRPGK